jgi:hypothetical protein
MDKNAGPTRAIRSLFFFLSTFVRVPLLPARQHLSNPPAFLSVTLIDHLSLNFSNFRHTLEQ